MCEMDDGNTECGLDRRLVGILSSWFPFYSCSLFKMSGGQACSNLALFGTLHKCLCRAMRLAVSWRGTKTGPF